jgi:uncharacterized protein YkwD
MVLIIIFIAFFVWLAISYNPIKKDTFATPYPIDFDGLDLDVFNEINKHRLIIGLNELKGALNLTEIAESHVNWMADNEISHYGFVDRQFKANAKAFAEVICTHKHTAENYLLTYLNSDKHKLAIEKTDVTHIGIYTNESGLQCILFGGY